MKRTTTILVIAGILLVIAVVIAFIFSNKDNPTNTSNTNSGINAPVVNISNSSNTNTNAQNALTTEEQQKNAAARAASIFTEQYGTFTGGFNADVFENIRPLITDTYATSLEKTVVSTSVNESVTISAQILNTTVTDFTVNTSAVARLSTLRIQTTGAEQAQTQLSQDIIIRLILSDGLWLVSSAEWQTPRNLDSL